MDSMRKGADWERQAAKPKKAQEREIFGLALWKQTERRMERRQWVCKGSIKPRGKTCPGACGWKCCVYRRSDPRVYRDPGWPFKFVSDTPTVICIVVEYNGQYAKELQDAKGHRFDPHMGHQKKKKNRCRDILNIKAIHTTLSTWDHNYKHFRKGYLNALCICYFYIYWHLYVDNKMQENIFQLRLVSSFLCYSISLFGPYSHTSERQDTLEQCICEGFDGVFISCTHMYPCFLKFEPIQTLWEFSLLLKRSYTT